MGKFSTTLPSCLPKLKHVNVVTVSLQPSIPFLGFGQVIFIKCIPKIFESAIQDLILPPHSLISVLYFSWLEDKKTYQAANTAIPLSPNKLTSNGRGTECCTLKKVWFLQPKKLLSKVSAADVPLICELRVQVFGIFELHLFSCEGGPCSELQSLPWVSK